MVVKIGIVGTRSRDQPDNYNLIKKALIKLISQIGVMLWEIHIISGGCSRGGDRFAEMLSIDSQLPITIFRAQWRAYNGAMAAVIRNKKIAEESDYLIACVSPERKGGTEITINEFIKKKGKDKLIIV